MTENSQLQLPADTTFFHVTHWKAGSQWVRGLLDDAFGRSAIVEPKENNRHLFEDKTRPGKVYPCAYLNKLEFDVLDLSEKFRRVVIIRDLRDTLVSWYFSVRNTRLTIGQVEKLRWFLHRLNQEQGLLYMMEVSLPACAYIQRSWLEAGEQVMKFEEFMLNPVAALDRFLRVFWGLDVPQPALLNLAERHSFKKYSGGRAPGQEDPKSHYRKGTHGDWRQYFTPRVLDLFKARYADLLILAGYEKDDQW